MKRVIVFLILVISYCSHAVTIKVQLENSNLKWDNAIEMLNNQFVPSNWDIVKGLTPTKSWVPGGVNQATPATITLSYAGQNVTIPFKVIGFEYNTGAVSPSKGEAESGSCSDINFSNTIIRVSGNVNCNYSHRLNTTTAYSPYSFIRPIFTINQADLIAAFNGKVKGKYIGSVSVSSFYYFYYDNEDSNIKSKFHHNHIVNLEVDYRSDFITSVSISGEREIPIIYHDNKISGEILLNGNISGFFSNGVKVSLKSTKDNYFLTGPSLMTIPYSIQCLSCEQSSLVNNGLVVNRNSRLLGSRVSSINFKLKVFYQDIDLSNLDTGYYNDSFVLIFEPDV